MSKRARITLDPDPEPTIEETPTATRRKTASKPKARARPKPQTEPEAGGRAGEKQASLRAAKSKVGPKTSDPDKASGAQAASPRNDTTPRESATPAGGWGPLPSRLDLRTILKVAVAGVVLASAVFLLKRKP